MAWATTTNTSYLLLTTARTVFILFLVPVLLILVIGRRRAFSAIAFVFAGASLLSLYSWIIFQVYTGGAESLPFAYATLVIITTAFATSLYLAPRGSPVITDVVAWMYIIFAVGILTATIVLDGLKLSGVPRFNYDFISESGNELMYSQGVSKFYGLAAVFGAVIFGRFKTNLSRKFALAGCILIFLIISLIGGGRGDFLVALLLSIIAIGRNKIILFTLMVTPVLMYAQEEIFSFASNYTMLLDRYAVLTYSLGMRDTLLADGFDLLKSEPVCVMFGCGIGYFQHYFGYPDGMPPHNVVLEFLISFGLLISVPITLLLSIGLARMYALEGLSSHFIFVFMFSAGIGLKSGSIINSYLLSGGVTFLCLKGVVYLIQRARSGRL